MITIELNAVIGGIVLGLAVGLMPLFMEKF
ncbi:hypothetical protein FOLKNPGA_03647 (plasmid) [Legionella sp. PC1000]|nr:hypothetical protein FOLKNPGA_03647 [Legionella sp. PC1000]